MSWGIVDPLGPHGGMHYYSHNQANALAMHGQNVRVYMADYPNTTAPSYKLITLFRHVYGHRPRPIRALTLVRDIVRCVIDIRFNGIKCTIYHVFKGDLFELLFFGMMYLMRRDTIAIVHDIERLDTKARPYLMPYILRISTHIMVHNSVSEAVLLNKFPNLKDKTFICFHGNYTVDYPRVPTRTEAKNILQLKESDFHILFFGNPRTEKGLVLLLNALSRFSSEREIRLIIAGRMKRQTLRDLLPLIQSLGVSNRVIIHPKRVSDEDLPFYFSSSNLVVLPYTRVYESGVALMGMSLGRAILASDLPTFKAIIKPNENGFLFRSNDPNDLYQKLNEISNLNEVALDKIGQSGNAWVKENRSWPDAVSILAKHVERVACH